MSEEIICPGRFNGKVLIITGATSGIGRACAIRAAKEGGKVVVSGRSVERGNSVVEEIKKNGGEAIFVAADMSKAEDIDNLFDKTLEKYGEVNVVVNNAGMMSSQLFHFEEFPEEEFLKVMNVNCTAVFRSMKRAGQIMKKQGKGGHIVNVSSVGGLIAFRGNTAYCTSKHAINGMTKVAAYDLANYNITVNSICPHFVETPMLLNGSSQPVPEGLDQLATYNMQKRMATPWEQAGTILYYGSDDANHITASIVAADGGYTSI